MAGNDGATTELFTGWSSVVHQPEDEPEESELPSTVDIGALSAEPSVPNHTQNNADSDSESEDSDGESSNSDGSEASQDSCSHSDSSDSDSSSSSQDSSSSSPTPEFSVTNTQTNGLRLTLTSVRKSNSSPINVMTKRNVEESPVTKNVVKKAKEQRKSSSSSSSNCSSDSSDDSDDSDEKISCKTPQKQAVKKSTGIPPKTKVIKADTSLKNSKEPEKSKQSPLPMRSRPVSQKETSVSKLKLSSSSSSIGSNSKEKTGAAANKDAESLKNRSHPSRLSSQDSTKNCSPTLQGKQRISTHSNTNLNTSREQSKEQALLPKLRSSSTIVHTGKDKDSQVVGKLRSSGSSSRDLREHRNLKDVKDSETKDSKSTSDSCYSSSSANNVNGGLKGKEQESGGGSHKLGEESLVKEVELKGGKPVDGKGGKRKTKLRKKTKKMASLPLSRSSTYSSSDSDSSDDLLPASCSLQEIRQEDLAAILPDQSECNDFNDFDQNHKDSPETGDLSGSDMELPQQAINNLIQRTTESSSDGESHQLPNPQTLFANSLLQQFVPNNPLLSPHGDNATSSVSDSLSPSKSLNTSSGSVGSSQNTSLVGNSKNSEDKPQNDPKNLLTVEVTTVKRGRGRPKRVIRERQIRNEENLRVLKGDKSLQDFCGAPNVSPDSGIQNSPDHSSSPEPSLSPNIRLRHLPQNREDLRKTAAKSREPRHSERIQSQEKQTKSLSQDRDERLSRRTRTQESQNASRNSSQENAMSSRRRVAPEKVNNALKTSAKEQTSSRNSSKEKLCSKASDTSSKEPNVNRIPVTSNQFDRLLYGKGDRVLYPPRRKVGRPPNVRRPGRPPKNKSDSAESKNGVQKAPAVKGKSGKRIQTVNNVKPPSSKTTKGITLKVPKILHSKHKHKHKKRKFKILKPVVCSDPKINQEIERLIGDFVKYCVIGSKSPREGPEQILKTLKKVTKKRRNTDYLEKKKKKQSVSTAVNKVTNSNEQRLPLKKRHYHLVSNNVEGHRVESEEPNEVTPVVSKPEKKEKTVEKDSKVVSSCPTASKGHLNNNEYEVKCEKAESESSSHIEEAIEACINKFSEDKLAKTEENLPESRVVPTTPKKRPRLENLNAEGDAVMSEAPEVTEIKKESSCNNAEEKCDKLNPTITVQSYINELKIKRNLINHQKSPERTDKDKKEEPNIKSEASTSVLEVRLRRGDCMEVKSPFQVPKSVPVSPESTKKKVRKRRAINRTGFPTVKRKKLKKTKVAPNESADVSLEEGLNSLNCDRVPKEGEEVNEFLERSSTNNSMQDLTTLNSENRPPSDDAISECESLPLDERIDFEPDGCSSRSESVASRTRSEVGDNETLSLLESSIERLRSRLVQKKLKRSRELKNSPETTNSYPKRRRREDSPASIIEPLENRLRDSTSVSSDELSKKTSKKVPRWKKKYLVAGLFSDYYKENDRQDSAKSYRALVYNPEEHPFGLMPPPSHCGKYQRCQEVDFQLPFDLWWQHTHSQLPGRDSVPSWNYKKIRTNVYNVKSNGGACEPQSCNCKPSSNCGDDCINRLVYAECPPSHRCLNQKIQKHEWAPGIEKFMTEDKGWGVRTKEPIRQGEFILEYVGEVVSDQEFKERMNSIYVNDTHHYCLHLDTGLVIDGHRMGSYGRFVNHSCQPNCEVQKWSVNGQFRMALFALRNIQPFEELTYDYNFSLFNPAEGQPCKCGSEQCRGVIGGKTQRIRQLPESTVTKVAGRVGRPRKTEARKKPNNSKDCSTSTSNVPLQQPIVPHIQVKPMSHQQKCFILEHHCFLLRNLTKVRKVRDRSQSVTSNTSRQQTATPTDTSTFMSQLNALQKPRNMKTRRTAQAEDDPHLNKAIKLAAMLKDILKEISEFKGEKGELFSNKLHQLPSKRKVPEFYQRVPEPIDLSTIEQNVATGLYKTPESFDDDMVKLFAGFSKFYGRSTDIGIATIKLKKLYAEIKQTKLVDFQNLVGSKQLNKCIKNKKKNEDEEDIIRCICGIPRDEGLMIQCERCMVWQHIECVKVEASVASYHCEVCVPRPVDYEIPMDDFTEHGHRYYMTLMRGDLQLRQGDTVYVLRDIPIAGTDKKHTYETIGKIDYSELDIFRIERLWKDKDTGKRFAYGHHYLRPHETFHEPTRKFFHNEVMRVPLYEAVPVELVMEHCWVMDLNTFCKGRPVDAKEEHVYICENRVDKGAKMFSKVSRSKFPICTKSFAFNRFENRLKITRTYCPHEVDQSLLKNAGVGRRKVEKDKEKPVVKEPTTASLGTQVQSTPVAPMTKTPAGQKARLNKILLNLLSKLSTKQVVDVSYLLEGGRRRKKLDVPKQ